MEDSYRGRGELVSLTAECPLVVGNGNCNEETRIQQPKPRKCSLSAIEEVASSQIFSSEAPAGMALSLAFLLQTTLIEIEEVEGSSEMSPEDPPGVAFLFQMTPAMSGLPAIDNQSPRLLGQIQ
jgi:hypothetical protein